MTTDPWTLLGLKRAFEIDEQQVQRAYLARLAQTHPDAAGGDGVEAAQLNDARAILLDAERRADALLVFEGGPTREACRDLPDGFLQEMLEIRMSIEEQGGVRDEQERAHWEQWGMQRRQSHVERVRELFRERPDELRAIRVELNAWRYIERLIEQLDPDYDPIRLEKDG